MKQSFALTTFSPLNCKARSRSTLCPLRNFDPYTYQMFAKLQGLNYRKGLFRVWVVGTAVWVAFAITEKESDINYAVQYAFNYDGLKQENEAKYQRERGELSGRLKFLEAEEKIRREAELAKKPLLDDYERMLREAGLPPSPKTTPSLYSNAYAVHNLLGRPQTPQEEIVSINNWVNLTRDTAPIYPDLRWLAFVLLPPPLFGLALLLGFLLLRQIVLWVGKGFSPN